MSAARDYLDFLADMFDAGRQVEEFTAGFDFEGFMRDRRTSAAVIRQLEIIGEAATQVPEAVRDRYPGLPWRWMVAMRNRLIHGYFGVDLAVVWDTAVRFVPPLVAELDQLLEELGREAGDE